MARSRSAASISIAISSSISSMVGRGLPGIQRETAIAPMTARAAAIAVVIRMASTNDASAGASRNRPAGPRCCASAWVAVIEVPAAFLRRLREPRQGRAERAAVGLREDRAEHGHAERDRDLAGGVGQGRPGARPLARQRLHDAGGRGGNGDAEPGALDEVEHRDDPDRRGRADERVAGDRDRVQQHARHADRPDPEPVRPAARCAAPSGTARARTAPPARRPRAGCSRGRSAGRSW